MFTWLNNLFPYSDLHSLNLDWILFKMKETAAQAAKAVADAANALAQVAEAKAAALTAQTAAQDAQTAANKAAGNAANAAANAVQALSAAQTAQETATAANNKAQTAQETATAANNKAQTAQETATAANNKAQTAQESANTAQSAAQTAQNTANTAQSAAETAQSAVDGANTEINSLKNRFPVKNIDIARNAVSTSNLTEKSVTLSRLAVLTSYLYTDTTPNGSARFPDGSGSASIDQITAGIVNTHISFIQHLTTEYIQIRINITENNDSKMYTSSSPIVICNNKTLKGIIAIAPIIVIKNNTNDIYNGFIVLSHVSGNSGLNIKCQVIFNSTTPFNDSTQFVITADAVSAKLSESK